MSDAIRFLMCPPEYFDVQYVINPWMEGNINKSSPQTALEQWQRLAQLIKEQASVEQVSPEPGLPDMVFTANAGLVAGDQVVLSRFLHRERKGEEPHFRDWFAKHGFTVHELPRDLPFEGAGDALLHRDGRTLWAGYGFRSELDSHPYLAEMLDLEVLSLRLMDKRFYHLDTCFCPLERGYVLYYPAAFDAHSNRLIEQRVPEAKRIPVSENDAVNFACNAVNIGRRVILNQASPELKARLQEANFTVIETPLAEFMKAGGGAKCLTLRLTEPVPKRARAAVAVESRVVRLEGHLLDSGLLSRALDLAVDAGGSFQILNFNLGTQRQSTSTAEVKISAPSAEALGKIMSQLIDLGAVMASPVAIHARLAAVTQPGVAPDDFYVTTIYPTEVNVNGQWVRVERQRMDGVVVVENSGAGVSPAASGVSPANAIASPPTHRGRDARSGSRDGRPTSAHCRLIRDLKAADQVVVGVEGIRTVRNPESRDDRGESSGTHEFSFMGAGVSSERRVELVVEQIAWELRRIRDQGGKVVVVAGPVVVHTGAGEHLARLIREGYVQVLLGGNAIAVHDMEQALLGTSLGVDLQRGVPVQGGHRHHLKAINLIRRCGSIAKAVEQGVLTSGIFYECIKHQVPFALAGSIRDDGPLPDTEMDLVRAQADYARWLEGADMILMLSSMLHSIGVGNMTPAGIKLVCVDINPAVVTKLSDRGSLESIGVVTDVGLFLSLLVQQLNK